MKPSMAPIITIFLIYHFVGQPYSLPACFLLPSFNVAAACRAFLVRNDLLECSFVCLSLKTGMWSIIPETGEYRLKVEGSNVDHYQLSV